MIQAANDNFSSLNFSCISRRANFCAHWVALHARKRTYRQTWDLHPHPFNYLVCWPKEKENAYVSTHPNVSGWFLEIQCETSPWEKIQSVLRIELKNAMKYDVFKPKKLTRILEN